MTEPPTPATHRTAAQESYNLAQDAFASPNFDPNAVADVLEVIMYATLSIAESLLAQGGAR